MPGGLGGDPRGPPWPTVHLPGPFGRVYNPQGAGPTMTFGWAFDWPFLQGSTSRCAPPGHEIWMRQLARAGRAHHPDLPYQSYGIWWTCGHPLVVVGGEKNSQKVILEVRAICKWVAFGPIQEPWRLVNSSGDLSSRRFGLGWSKAPSKTSISGCFSVVKQGRWPPKI